MRQYFAIVTLVLAFAVSSFAQAKPSGVKHHALAKVGLAVTFPVRHSVKTLKATLGSVLFVVENGVDGAHLVLDYADKGLSAVSAQGKIPVLNEVYAVVEVADKDSAKLDGWLERQESFLFGTSN